MDRSTHPHGFSFIIEARRHAAETTACKLVCLSCIVTAGKEKRKQEAICQECKCMTKIQDAEMILIQVKFQCQVVVQQYSIFLFLIIFLNESS